MRKLVIGIIASALVLLWLCRYSVVSGGPGAYRLDRLTGKVTVISSDIRLPVYEFPVIKVSKVSVEP